MMQTEAICGLLVSQLLQPFRSEHKTRFGFAGNDLLERTFPRKIVCTVFFIYMHLDFSFIKSLHTSPLQRRELSEDIS